MCNAYLLKNSFSVTLTICKKNIDPNCYWSKEIKKCKESVTVKG